MKVHTDDHFLAGRLVLRQFATGYRAGMDAMLLGAAAAALPFDRALDVGCGTGAALLAAALRSGPSGRLTGLEKDEAAAGLARHNATANGLAASVGIVHGDVLAPPAELLGQCDLVFSNPPFFDDESAIRPPSAERAAAWVSGVPLEQWVKAMAKLAAPNGRLLVLHRADRLGDLLAAFAGRAGEATVYPVRPRPSDPAKRMIVAARLGSKAPLRLLKGLDLHPDDPAQGRFTPEAAAVFERAPLPGFPV
jgi:tRNA1Val (adenine37-N6)-methyltransferase